MGHFHTNDTFAMSDARLLTAVAVNGLLTVVQGVGGLLSGSLSLVADALHNLSDGGGAADRLGRASDRPQPADRFQTFGYRRVELVGALINSNDAQHRRTVSGLRGGDAAGRPAAGGGVDRGNCCRRRVRDRRCHCAAHLLDGQGQPEREGGVRPQRDRRVGVGRGGRGRHPHPAVSALSCRCRRDLPDRWLRPVPGYGHHP